MRHRRNPCGDADARGSRRRKQSDDRGRCRRDASDLPEAEGVAAVILAIDPGNEQSAFVLYDDGAIKRFGKVENGRLVEVLEEIGAGVPYHTSLAIEMIASYGMPVGREVFETCVWIGRFMQTWPFLSTWIYRKDVKLHLCNSPRANDA